MMTLPNADPSAQSLARAGSTLPWPTRHARIILLLLSVTVVAVTAYGLTVIVRKGWSTVFASTDPVPARKVASPPTLASMESRVRTEHDLAHRVQAGVPSTFALIKGGAGERLILPPNSAGITEVIVELDPSGQTVWLAYGGEVTGKGTRGLPRGAVEQLVRDRPTVLVFTFSTPTMSRGVEWVLGMVEVSDSQESAADLFTTKWPDDWATRFRNEWISKSGSGPAAVPADAGGVTR